MNRPDKRSAGSATPAEELAACMRLSDEIDRRLAAMLARLDKLEGKGK